MTDSQIYHVLFDFNPLWLIVGIGLGWLIRSRRAP